MDIHTPYTCMMDYILSLHSTHTILCRVDTRGRSICICSSSTHDAAPEVGVDNGLCQANIKKGWSNMLKLASTQDGRSQLAEIFNLCNVPETKMDASVVLDIVEESISYMAMSSYPYASNYISGAVCGTTTGSLPAYPPNMHAMNI